jgi:single-strand DNA-binding protein
MSHCAEFQIIGRIGQIKTVGTTLRVTIAAAYPYKDDHGEWKERTRWNEITVFNDARQSYVQRNLKPGDLIRATGTLEQTSWEKNGGTHYGVSLACEQIGRLAKGPGHAAGAAGPAPRSSSNAIDDDIPF